MSLLKINMVLGAIAVFSMTSLAAQAAGKNGSLFGLDVRFAQIDGAGNITYLDSDSADKSALSNSCFRQAITKTKGSIETVRTSAVYSDALRAYKDKCKDSPVNLSLNLVATNVQQPSAQLEFLTLSIEEKGRDAKFALPKSKVLDLAGTEPDNQTTIATTNDDGSSATMIGYKFKDDSSDCSALDGDVVAKIQTDVIAAEVADILKARSAICEPAQEPAVSDVISPASDPSDQAAPTLSVPAQKVPTRSKRPAPNSETSLSPKLAPSKPAAAKPAAPAPSSNDLQELTPADLEGIAGSGA